MLACRADARFISRALRRSCASTISEDKTAPTAASASPTADVVASIPAGQLVQLGTGSCCSSKSPDGPPRLAMARSLEASLGAGRLEVERPGRAELGELSGAVCCEPSESTLRAKLRLRAPRVAESSEHELATDGDEASLRRMKPATEPSRSDILRFELAVWVPTCFGSNRRGLAASVCVSITMLACRHMPPLSATAIVA